MPMITLLVITLACSTQFAAACPVTLDLDWEYEADKNAFLSPNFITLAHVQLLGGSTSTFNQLRNGGKIPFEKAIMRFLNIDRYSKQVAVAHSFTTLKAIDQKDSTMTVQLVVYHKTTLNANRSLNAFLACVSCNTTLLLLNDLIKVEMLGRGTNSYTTFQQATIDSVLIREIKEIDRAALITIATWCAFFAMSTGIFLMANGKNLELFPVDEDLFMPIYIRRNQG